MIHKILIDLEHRIIALLADVKLSKEIARIIKMSVKTVDAFRRGIKQKPGVDNVAELFKYAILAGLTSVDI